jgi:glycosyltransferase involved in cell wall biosynthesis
MKIRVIHVIPTLAPMTGGTSVAAIGMTRALARRGHKVYLLTTNSKGVLPSSEALTRDGVDYQIFKVRFPQAYVYAPDLTRALKRLLASTDIVHIHSLYYHPTVTAGLTALRNGVPYIIRPAGALDPYHYGRKRFKKATFDFMIQNKVLRHASAFHFTTHVEQELSKPYTFARPGIVVPNGVDLGSPERPLAPGAFRRRYPETGNRKIILFLGRINYKKGFEILIPAFGRLLKQRSDVQLVIAGNDYGYTDTVKQLILQYGVSRHVTWPGFLDGREKLEAMADSNIFVLPSYSENFSNAVFEALAAGLPAIISNRVNSWPEIKAAEAALIIEPEVKSLVEALHFLLTDDAACKAIGSRAALFARSRYGWDTVAGKMEAAYAQILGISASPN